MLKGFIRKLKNLIKILIKMFTLEALLKDMPKWNDYIVQMGSNPNHFPTDRAKFIFLSEMAVAKKLLSKNEIMLVCSHHFEKAVLAQVELNSESLYAICLYVLEHDLENKVVSYRFYDFKSHWDEFIPLLEDLRTQKAVNYILDHIIDINIPRKSSTDDFYRYTPEFANLIHNLDDRNEQRKLVNAKGWGKFSICENPENVSEEYRDMLMEELNDYRMVAQDIYDDPKTLEHYFLYHNCETIVLLILTLCKLRWPEYEWLLCSGNYHWWVMRKDDPYTIYDFLWQYISKAHPTDFVAKDLKRFEHPYNCIDMYMNVPNILGLSENEIRNALINDYQEKSITYGSYDYNLEDDLQDYLNAKYAFDWV